MELVDALLSTGMAGGGATVGRVAAFAWHSRSGDVDSRLELTYQLLADLRTPIDE